MKNIGLEYRTEKEVLDDVCLDCKDFLNHPCVECVDCPVERLKTRFDKYKGERKCIKGADTSPTANVE